MNDTYQPIYDAIRSRIGGCDVGQAISDGVNSALGFMMPAVQDQFQALIADHRRPSVLFRPEIAKDGNAWIALLGDNLQVGVVGVGDTPEEAMLDFDKSWYKSASAS